MTGSLCRKHDTSVSTVQPKNSLELLRIFRSWALKRLRTSSRQLVELRIYAFKCMKPRQRLRDLRKLMRCLFQAFELDETIKTKDDGLTVAMLHPPGDGRWALFLSFMSTFHADLPCALSGLPELDKSQAQLGFVAKLAAGKA